MAEETRFHERKIDRTAYTALWLVISGVLIFYIIGAYLLFQAGTAMRHFSFKTLQTPHISLPNPASAVQQVGSQASAAANKGVNQAENQAKQAASQKLNQFISP